MERLMWRLQSYKEAKTLVKVCQEGDVIEILKWHTSGGKIPNYHHKKEKQDNHYVIYTGEGTVVHLSGEVKQEFLVDVAAYFLCKVVQPNLLLSKIDVEKRDSMMIAERAISQVGVGAYSIWPDCVQFVIFCAFKDRPTFAETPETDVKSFSDQQSWMDPERYDSDVKIFSDQQSVKDVISEEEDDGGWGYLREKKSRILQISSEQQSLKDAIERQGFQGLSEQQREAVAALDPRVIEIMCQQQSIRPQCESDEFYERHVEPYTSRPRINRETMFRLRGASAGVAKR